MPYTIRDAARDDLPAIVAIYNASIPGRLATADTEPVTVASREAWFAEHAQGAYPLWVAETDRCNRRHGLASAPSTAGTSAYRADRGD